MAYKFAKQSEVKELESWCMDILHAVQEEVRDYFTFDIRLIGSGDKRLVTQNSDESFDLDYNIILQRDKKGLLNNPKQIKDIFVSRFNKILKECVSDYTHTCDSTSVITVKLIRNNKLHFSFDVAIVVEGDDGLFYRLINDKSTGRYIWNQVNKFDIANEDTLTKPQHWDDEPFEAIVSNPPYSTKWKGSDDPLLINDPRFSPAGILAPKSYADMAFIMHSLSWLATSGVAAIVCFPGIFYRGGAEQKIRKYLIENNFIDCIIQLPSNLFFGTSIATCIMVLKKSKTSNDVLFIDASAECVKVTNNNKLTETNIENILHLFTERKDVEYTSKVVPNAVIGENDFNLSVSTYVEKQDTREKVDIKELNKQIAEIVAREQVLRDEIDKIIAEINE